MALTVSLGNTLVTPPDLPSALPVAEAQARIAEAGLRDGRRSDEFDEDVPADALIAATLDPVPDAQGKVPKGGRVDLTVSKGPQPRVVPAGLVSKPFDEVAGALTALRLRVNRVDQFSDAAVGTVLSLSQPDGASVPRDSTVDVVVSKGPELVAIPNVLGRTGADAAGILESQGFVIDNVDGSPSNKVTAMTPAPGEMKPRNSAVRLTTRP
ncbi:MAG: PASTA domain-containing protein [Microthrixaceae bacterium]